MCLYHPSNISKNAACSLLYPSGFSRHRAQGCPVQEAPGLQGEFITTTRMCYLDSNGLKQMPETVQAEAETPKPAEPKPVEAKPVEPETGSTGTIKITRKAPEW